MRSTVVTVTLNPALDKTVTVRQFQIGGLNRVQEARTDPGGKGINVAKVLRQFAVPVKATGFIAGLQGRQLLTRLQELNISADFCELPGELRTNLKVYDDVSKLTTEINEPGFNVSDSDLAGLKQKLESLLADAEILVIGGSLPQGAPDWLYREYVELARRYGVKTILDADGTALREGIKAKPFAVKPNLHELECLTGRKLESLQAVVAAGEELISQGVRLALVSLGSKGAVAVNQDEIYYAKPFPIIPLSTVGAGDSMVAALAYCLIHNKSLQETIEWATTAGTVTAEKPGTQVCTLAEVERYLSRVEATKLEEGKEE
ncbi:MAG: 1-phosphofructokinase [Brevibacillus sp.]|nr:1-phosphofructokinase [Brevibacillus sp.]